MPPSFGQNVVYPFLLLSGILDGPHAVWAALSTSGIMALRLPPDPAKLIIAHDNDENGAGQQAAVVLADRATALGWQVSLMDPGDGRDFNDVLQRGDL